MKVIETANDLRKNKKKWRFFSHCVEDQCGFNITT